MYEIVDGANVNSELPILEDPAEVSAEWLTAIMQSSGHDVVVGSFRRSAVGTGQMAHLERYLLCYAAGSMPAPNSIVIKFPSPDETSRAAGASGGYLTEVRFYQELASTLTVSVPRCFHGDVSEDSSTFTLVLEDLAPAMQGDQIAGATDEQVITAATNLAGLHGPRWNDPELTQIGWLASSGEQAVAYIEVVMPIFLERYSDRMSKRAQMVLGEFGAKCGNWIARQPTDITLVHGDYRLDNLMFAPSCGAAAVTAVDWQTLGLGSGGRDLAYLLGNSSEPTDRRRHEQATLDAYGNAMADAGVILDDDQLGLMYAHGAFQGPFITALGSIMVGRTKRGDEMFMAMAERSAAQIIDLGALELIH